ncbi:MAG: carbamoyltransferase HypF [Bellilinea sp.]|nr:MAG: carbamoyltransferase HypF [Bellilinea sp.]
MNVEGVAVRVLVRGIVQGVGFRPFIYSLAQKNSLKGWVRNTSGNVEIHLEGTSNHLEQFLFELQNRLPPLARIDSLQIIPTQPEYSNDFLILSSQSDPAQFQPIPPDTAICADCRRELFDPLDRRYHYPFINCTNCGPRFTIIQSLPYDRPNTTMAAFPMCHSCSEEFENPTDRRFHAQPVACPDCGPQVWFEVEGQPIAFKEDAIQTARQWLKQGKILAVKGLGGFHLACDATNEKAVQLLRERKQRSDKPFALMAFDLKAIEEYCLVNSQEKEWLESRFAPIVLLQTRQPQRLPEIIAPRQKRLGFMLAYTPLHLLLTEPEEGYPSVLVMTSGNLSDEPIAYRDDQARRQLASLADAFLFHNREIHMRVDDSVIQSHRSKPYFIRRSRGFAPDGLIIHQELPPLLAVGAELKNTFCLTRGQYAFLSHYIGDMENYETFQSFEEGIAHFERVFQIKPQAIACDQHPDYLATRYAIQRSRSQNLPLIQVQHHHAHLVSCLADNQYPFEQQVIGVILDGTGYGSDGAIWGGEFLLGNQAGFQRLLHLKYVPLPGGDAATRRVSRITLAHLWSAGLEWEADLPAVKTLCEEERTLLRTQLERRINTPLTSSMGRLFDAVAGLLGIRDRVTYEGQAAIELENLADENELGVYPFSINKDEVDLLMLWEAILSDWRKGIPPPIIAGRFHNAVAHLILEAAQTIRQISGVKTVVLSGGVWQNQLLLKKTLPLLENSSFEVLTHQRVPANDGGIALGQALIAAHQLQFSSFSQEG